MGLHHHIVYVRLVSFKAGAHDILPRRRFDDSPRTPGEIFTTYDWAIGLNSGRDLTRLTTFLAHDYPQHRIIRFTPVADHWDKEVKIVSIDEFTRLNHAVPPAFMLSALAGSTINPTHAST